MYIKVIICFGSSIKYGDSLLAPGIGCLDNISRDMSVKLSGQIQPYSKPPTFRRQIA